MRRALHRLLSVTAVALIAAATVALPGSPALAAEPSVRLHFPDLAVAGSVPKASPLYLFVDVPEMPGIPVVVTGDLTVRVDTAGVQKIATVAPVQEFGSGEFCRTAGTVITCTFPGPLGLEAGLSVLPVLALQATAKPGAAQDASGELAFSARIGTGQPFTGRSTVTIGESVDLAGVISAPRTVAAGTTVETGFQVTNAGTTRAKGAVLVLAGWDPALSEGAGASNCTYGAVTVCTFTEELAPGTSYELTSPFRLKIPADAAAGSRASALGSWFTPSDFKELLGAALELELGPEGTGPAVGLTVVSPRAAARAAASQVDTDPENNVLSSEFVVGGKRPDMAAIGAELSGNPGDKIKATVGFVNNGPGTLYHWTFENTDPGTFMTVPPGTEVVEADDRCFPVDFPDGAEPDFADDDSIGFPGASSYLCMAMEGKTAAKASTRYAFTFQIRTDPSTTAGTVEINDELYAGADIDRDSTNDTAKITLTVGSGGGGGGLPVTGANAGLIGAGGAALLLGGLVGVLLVRRRRVRFTA